MKTQALDLNDRILTINIENKSDKVKEALLFGSLINLNGELDDPDVKIEIPESSHAFVKRDLLSKNMHISKIKIYSKNGFKEFDKKIFFIQNSSFGSFCQRCLLIDCKDEDTIVDKDINFFLSSDRCLKINMPALTSFNILMNFTEIIEMSGIKKEKKYSKFKKLFLKLWQKRF